MQYPIPFMKNNACLFIFLFTSSFCFLYSLHAQPFEKFELGINICGAEFGEKNLPGTLGTDYIFPSERQIAYFAKKGFKTIVLPFKWERIQPKLGEELDLSYVTLIKQFLLDCKKNNVQSIITMQNFAKYRIADQEHSLGSKQLPIELFSDVWKRIAGIFATENSVWGYDIMNEPRGIYGRNWFKAAQSAIDAIRMHDTTAYVIVDGENGSFSYEWKYDNDKLKDLKDQWNKVIYDAHCYFDYDHSGRYDSTYTRKIDEKIGIKFVKPFIDWLKKYNKRGIVGEFGIPANNEKWEMVMRNFLDYLKAQGVQANYWAAGIWWGKYALSIEPENEIDKPQMKILEHYLPKQFPNFFPFF